MKTLRILSLLAVFGLVFSPGRFSARADNVSEYAVKAAYLYNFTKFVQWPGKAFGSASSPLVIGVVGDDPFGSALDDAVGGKSADDHPLAIKRFGAFDASKGGALRKCQILFIAFSEQDHVRDILEALAGAPVLTVSEIEKFQVKGGMVLFDQEGQKISLVVNPKAAEKAGISLKTRLLQLSTIYKGG